MKRIVVLCLIVVALLSGCGPYVQVQRDLITQAQRGIALAGEHHSALHEREREYAKLRRERLDDAFDSDVRERGELDAEWVIEHRKAYALALDAFAADAAQSETSARIAQENLKAVEAALEQLMWLQSIPMQILEPRKEDQP